MVLLLNISSSDKEVQQLLSSIGNGKCVESEEVRHIYKILSKKFDIHSTIFYRDAGNFF